MLKAGIDSIVNAFDTYAKTLSGSVAVAVSGGPDSLALVLLLNQWRKSQDAAGTLGRLVVLTVNHNLRPAGAAEADYVHQLMQAQGIEHHVLTWQPDERVMANIQCRAREARLGLLTEWCKTNKIKTLLLAHTKNDVAETFLMNILRGSGIHGLTSIPQENLYNGVQLVRPLLGTTKDELKACLVEWGIGWIDDPSNEDEKFLRVKVRKLLTGPTLRNLLTDSSVDLIDRLMINVENIRRVKSFIDESVDQAVARVVRLHAAGYVTINRRDFEQLHPEIGLHVLANCLVTVSGSHVYGPRLESLQSLYDTIRNSDKPFVKTLWECEIQAKDGVVYIYKEMGKKEPDLKQLSEKTWLWDRRFLVEVSDNARVDSIACFTPSQLKNLRRSQSSRVCHPREGGDDKVGVASLSPTPIRKIAFTLPVITLNAQGKRLDYTPFVSQACDQVRVSFYPKMNLLVRQVIE